MKFGLGLFSDKDVRVLAEHIRLAERFGFDSAWVSNQFFNRNVFVILTYAATLTKRIKLGVGVVDPFFRHPSILAQGMASLNEVSNGRAIFGIGSGQVEGSETSPAYSLKDRLKVGRPLTVTREAIEIIKQFFEGKNVTYSGEAFRLEDCKLTFPPMKIPIYVGARRRLMIQLAGELADGILTHGIDPGYVAYVIGQLKIGAEKSGRSLRNYDVATWAYLSTSKSEYARSAMKICTAWLSESLPEEAIPHMDLTEGSLLKIRKLGQLIRKGMVKEATEYVDTKLIDAMHVFGDEDKCINAIDKMIRNGITHIVFSAIDEEINQVIRFIGKRIIPYFIK